MTSAQETSDMNSQQSRYENASSASATRFMPARKAGKDGSTRCGAGSRWADARPERVGDPPPRMTDTRKNETSVSHRKTAPNPRERNGKGSFGEFDVLPTSPR